MKARSSIVAGGQGARLFGAGMLAAGVVGFWFIFGLQRDIPFGQVLPLPGIVALAAFGAIVAQRQRGWKRRLSPTPLEDLGEGELAIEGIVRHLDRKLVSPYTDRECVAWLGWFIARGGDDSYHERATALPFVIELPDGSATVIRFSESDEGVRVWNHLGHEEEIVREAGEAPLGEEDRERIRNFLGAASPRWSLPNFRPVREVVYADGDRVVLAGKFHRREDAATYRSIKGLPVYEVSGDVVFAKGPAALHRRLLSPWLRAYWPVCVAAACGVEVVVQFVLMIVSVWVHMAR